MHFSYHLIQGSIKAGHDIANFDHGANYRASGLRTENKLSNCTQLLINSGVQIVVGVAGIYYLVDMKPLDEW